MKKIGVASGMLAAVKSWAVGEAALKRVPSDMRNIPSFEILSSAPSYVPHVGWLPQGYRFVHAARGARVGFGTSDEILLLYGNPKVDGGPRSALHILSTFRKDVRLKGTYFREREGEALLKELRIQEEDLLVQYFQGEFVNGSGGSKPEWSKQNRHSIVFRTRGLTVAIRGARRAGVDEFELYAIAESLIIPAVCSK